MRHRTCIVVGLAIALLAGTALAQSIPNWSAPPTWQPATGGRTASAMSGESGVTDVTDPVPFIGVTPCRVADTRGNGFTGQYGPPALVSGANRTFTITGQCGIPGGAEAVSFNFTIVGMTTAGDLRVYPAGSSLPLVSTQNWTASTGVIANAAIVPLGSGGITVHLDGLGSANLLIDVNGYYARYINSSEYFGIQGNEAGGVIFGRNDTTSLGFGVRGQMSYGAAGSAGVYGEYYGSAAGYGVEGLSSGTAADTSAVFGQMNGTWAFQGSGNTGYNEHNGVRGESGDTGILGLGNLRGVQGTAYTTAGSMYGWGTLGMVLGSTAYGVYGGGGFAATTNYGVFSAGDFGGTGAKYFIEPHPTEAGTVIRYVALEGPEAGTYFRGKGQFVARTAVIDVPESFRLVTDPEGLSIQVTPIGDLATVAVVSIGLDRIDLKSSGDVAFFYTVNGVRHTFKDLQAMVQSGEFTPESADAKIPEFLSAEQKRYLIQNGTYNADGTVNMQTAARLGWTKVWQAREEAIKASAEKASARPFGQGQGQLSQRP